MRGEIRDYTPAKESRRGEEEKREQGDSIATRTGCTIGRGWKEGRMKRGKHNAFRKKFAFHEVSYGTAGPPRGLTEKKPNRFRPTGSMFVLLAVRADRFTSTETDDFPWKQPGCLISNEPSAESSSSNGKRGKGRKGTAGSEVVTQGVDESFHASRGASQRSTFENGKRSNSHHRHSHYRHPTQFMVGYNSIFRDFIQTRDRALMFYPRFNVCRSLTFLLVRKKKKNK